MIDHAVGEITVCFVDWTDVAFLFCEETNVFRHCVICLFVGTSLLYITEAYELMVKEQTTQLSQHRM
jgi:hypothetical protein